ncbi:MAG: abortive infection family protein [Cetobacterium sp.]
MKLSKTGNSVLATLICDDNRLYKYRTYSELQTLFYGNYDGENVEGNRKFYCEFALNNIKNLETLLKEISDYRNFEYKSEIIQDEYIKKLNQILEGDNLKIKKQSKSNLILIKINEIENKIMKDELKSKDILTLSYIEEQIQKIQNKILNEDYSGAITNSKTLLEQVVRDLSTILESEYLDNNFKKSFDNLRSKMNLEPKNYKIDSFRKIISGLASSLDGVIEIRNKCSDGHSRMYNPEKHHAKLCANASLTISEFLVESYLYQNKLGKI